MSMARCPYCEEMFDTDYIDAQEIDGEQYHLDCAMQIEDDAEVAQYDRDVEDDSFSIRDLGIIPDIDEEC